MTVQVLAAGLLKNRPRLPKPAVYEHPARDAIRRRRAPAAAKPDPDAFRRFFGGRAVHHKPEGGEPR